MIPLLLMTGEVENVYLSDENKNKAGETYGGKWTVQIRGAIPLRDTDGYRLQSVDLRTEHHLWFKERMGKRVSVPVDCMNGKSAPIYFILKSWQPNAFNPMGEQPDQAD